jgi:hypothetical protein
MVPPFWQNELEFINENNAARLEVGSIPLVEMPLPDAALISEEQSKIDLHQSPRNPAG